MRLKDLPIIIRSLRSKGHEVVKQNHYLNVRVCYRIDGVLYTDYEVLLWL